MDLAVAVWPDIRAPFAATQHATTPDAKAASDARGQDWTNRIKSHLTRGGEHDRKSGTGFPSRQTQSVCRRIMSITR